MKIATKSQFYELWQSGLLGNRPAAWRSLRELQLSGFRGLVTIRYKGRGGGGLVRTHVPIRQLEQVTAELGDSGADLGLLTFHESMPDELLLVQGEVGRGAKGLELSYSLTPKISMREAMRAPQVASGLSAQTILDHFLDSNSRDDLDILLDRYPDAVVEFGTYAVDVGVFPRRNTIFWEVRDY